MRGDIIKRTLVTVTGIAILWYLGWLYSQGAVVVQSEYETYNTLAYVLLAIVAIYYTVMYGVYPMNIKWHKRTFIVVGLACIMMAFAYLIDDPEKSIYIGDFMRLLGVVLVVFGGSGYLIPAKIQKKKAEAELEIIEA